MTLSTEETNEIKNHLMGQLENFPEDKREDIKAKIESMTSDEVENFVKQNSLNHLGGQCIFCEIVAGKKPTVKIAENASSIAILELNPLSKGHILIVPKDHSEALPDSIDDMANQISNKLREKFNPEDIKRNELEIMGHKLLEVIPIYGGETKRRPATEQELQNIKEELLSHEDPKANINPATSHPTIPKFPARIP